VSVVDRDTEVAVIELVETDPNEVEVHAPAGKTAHA
jgi:hypothetical protein